MEEFLQVFRQQRQTSSSLKIISHNTFWFQGAGFGGDQPPAPVPIVLAGLCAVYKKLAPDILCLQEVQDEGVAQTVAATLGMEVHYTAGKRYPQYGGAVLSRYPLEPLSVRYDAIDRVIQQVNVLLPGGNILHVANVHLPSSRFRGVEGGRVQRLHELSLLSRESDILLGDFNETPGGACATWLCDNGFVDVAEKCGADEVTSNIAGSRGDYIWLNASKSQSLQGYFVVPREQLPVGDGQRKYLSDHLPIGCWLG